MENININKFKWGLIGLVFIFVLFAVILVIAGIAKDTQKSPQGSKLPVQGKQQDVQIRNIFQNPLEQTKDVLVIAQKLEYKIVYFKADETFLISLERSPLKQSQSLAESEFLTTLQITKEQACNLNVTVSVSKEADLQKAGQNFALSFCPGGQSF